MKFAVAGLNRCRLAKRRVLKKGALLVLARHVFRFITTEAVMHEAQAKRLVSLFLEFS